MKRRMKKIFCMLMAVSVLATSPTAVYATGADTESSDTAESDADTTTSDTETTESETTETSADAQTSTDTESTETSSEDTGSSTDVKGTVTSNTGSDSSEASSETTGDDVVITEEDKPYLALGADLSEEQKNTVLGLMGIDPASLDSYDVVYVTNAEEHSYLDQYIDSSAIGTRSLSSVVIVKRDAGNGLNISTSNINYCTVGMYKNALTTAGITDADIIVAGPTSISGTAALVGIFKAYKEVTGEDISDDVVDAALNELVITGKLEDSIDGLTDEQVEEFIAYVKSVIAEKGLDDEESINEALDEACEKYGVTLTDEERQQIIDLLLKISSLDIDLSALVDYASSLYDSFKGSGDASGVFESIGQFFSNLFSSIGDFFKGLFS